MRGEGDPRSSFDKEAKEDGGTRAGGEPREVENSRHGKERAGYPPMI